MRARGQFATRAPSTASVNERERVSDVMSASNGRTIGASERAALLGTDANTQDRATDDGDEEAWERSLVEAPRRSFGARAAVVTVATLACGAFAAIASTHATGGEVSLFASALGSTRGERVERLEARERLSHGNKRERRQAKQMKRQAGRASEDSSEKAEEETKDDGATDESAKDVDGDTDAKKSEDDSEDKKDRGRLGVGSVAGAAPTRRNNRNRIPQQKKQREVGRVNVDVSKVPKTYIIADTEPSKDKSRAQVAHDYIVNSFMKYAGLSEAEAKKMTAFSEAVYPTRWPKTLNAARDAVAGMMDGDDRRFPVMDVKAALADKDHRCVTGACKAGLNHHLGCALSHMAVWKKGLDSGAQTFVTWESDGMGIHAVHPLDYAELARQVPKDADMIWLNDITYRGSGQFVKKFKSQSAGKWAQRTHGGDMTTLSSSLGESTVKVNQTANVYIHKFNKICGWAGAGAIMWTRSGAQRLRDYVNEHGAGMIDAWLAGQCINHRPGGLNLNCYAAQSRPVVKEHVGGYLPDWYYDESRTGEVPQHMIDEMDRNPLKYNQLGCQRGGEEFKKQAWIPIGWEKAETEKEFDQTVDRCLPMDAAKTIGFNIDPCNAHLPMHGNRKDFVAANKAYGERRAREAKNKATGMADLAAAEKLLSREQRKVLFEDPDEQFPFNPMDAVEEAMAAAEELA